MDDVPSGKKILYLETGKKFQTFLTNTQQAKIANDVDVFQDNSTPTAKAETIKPRQGEKKIQAKYHLLFLPDIRAPVLFRNTCQILFVVQGRKHENISSRNWQIRVCFASRVHIKVPELK